MLATDVRRALKFEAAASTICQIVLLLLSILPINVSCVKVKSPDTAEKDETTQTSNTRNSKTAAVRSMILLQKM